MEWSIEFVRSVIKELRKIAFDCVIAPEKSDLAYKFCSIMSDSKTSGKTLVNFSL